MAARGSPAHSRETRAVKNHRLKNKNGNGISGPTFVRTRADGVKMASLILPASFRYGSASAELAQPGKNPALNVTSGEAKTDHRSGQSPA